MSINQQTGTIVGSSRKLAAAAGVCYLITHVTSIGAAALYSPVLNNPGYINSAGTDIPVIVGAIFEIILALTIIGTAVALYPIAKGQNEGLALGYVGLRTLEAGIIAVGVIPLLAVVTLRQHLTGTADPATLAVLNSTFVAFYKWTSLIGPGLVCGTNTVLMAYLMYKSRLVPRFIPVLGLIGGPLIFAITVGRMLGSSDQLPLWAGVAVLPIFAWEVTFAIRLITKGFNEAAAAAESPAAATSELLGVA